MPADLDTVSLDLFAAQLSARSDVPEWPGIAAALNGIRWRFRATADADDVIRATFADPKHGHHDEEERFRQENALFSFFVNGAASFEALYYASYLVGAMLKPIQFPAGAAKDLRKHPSDVVKCYRSAYTGDAFTLALDAAQSSKQAAVLFDYRDMYIHRGALPRHHQVRFDAATRTANLSDIERTTIAANPKDLPGRWQPTLELGPDISRGHRAWLASTLSTLSQSAAAFCRARLK